MKELEEVQREVELLSKAMAGFAGSEAHKVLNLLLESLQACYMHELADVDGESLKFKQGALRQVMALRRSINSKGVALPRV